MSTETQQTYIASLGGELTPEQAAHLLDMPADDDLSALAGTVQPDSISTETDVAADPASAVPAESTTPQYTPDYQKLAQEHELKAQNLQSENEALARELEALKQAGGKGLPEQQPSATAQAAVQAIEQGADVSLFGDFSEEAMTKGLEELNRRSAEKIGAEIRAEIMGRLDQLEAKVAPIDEQRAAEATQAHYRAILEKHPDAPQIADSKELNDWLSAQPDYLQATYQQVMGSGSAAQINDLLDRFKRDTGTAPVQSTPDHLEALKAAAAAKVQQAKPAIPNSLSDIPGTRPPSDPNELLRSQNGAQLIDSFEGKTPEQINALLNQL